jgi:hypothetical protein
LDCFNAGLRGQVQVCVFATYKSQAEEEESDDFGHGTVQKFQMNSSQMDMKTMPIVLCKVHMFKSGKSSLSIRLISAVSRGQK